MKKISVVFLWLFIVGFLWAGDSVKVVEKIKSVMESQRIAWNEANLDGYMSAYWKSDDLIFQSGNRRQKGWNTLYAMYKKNYAGEKMGVLDFTEVVVNVVSNDCAYVIGHWKVTAKDSVKEGEFTLILKRFDRDWKITLDHSS